MPESFSELIYVSGSVIELCDFAQVSFQKHEVIKEQDICLYLVNSSV